MSTSPHPALCPGRTAAITGGAGGIGLAVADRLAGLGMRLCIVDVDDLPDDVVDRLRRAGAAEVLTAKVDVEDASAMVSLAGSLRRRFGEIAFLMNNAACGGGGRPFEDPEGWRRILDVKFGGRAQRCAGVLAGHDRTVDTLCADNGTPRWLDEQRILWSGGTSCKAGPRSPDGIRTTRMHLPPSWRKRDPNPDNEGESIPISGDLKNDQDRHVRTSSPRHLDGAVP